MAVTFDLFGTLVAVSRPSEPSAAVAESLAARDVAVPEDWRDAYREVHVDAPPGAEVPLPAHVAAALRSRGVEADDSLIRRAVVAAFDPEVHTRAGAVAAVDGAGENGPVGLLSNCSVPELASRTLIRSGLDRDGFDAIVTSVGCGWRKPHERAFETAVEELGVASGDLTHVGDDPETDGGIEALGGRFLDVRNHPLDSLASAWRSGDEPCR